MTSIHPDTTPESIGDLLRKHRVQQNLPQKKIAALTGLSESTISEIENGKYPLVGWRSILLIAEALNLAPVVHFRKKHILFESVTDVIEHHSDGKRSHCSGTGFTIVWDTSPSFTQADRDGAIAPDIILATLKHMEDLHQRNGGAKRTGDAIVLLTRLLLVLQKEEVRY